uniref:TLDc domain-containing protein n=1 Tax=Rhizophagus irregularis (strain DAOM 181602 / DAOM 197198 / MUCL 43194) TaxID=747089 RepID=U9UZ98_RHIID
MEPKSNVALSSRLKFNSALIKSKHILLKFASWIDRKDSSYNKYDNPYKFKLLYRSDRDGFNNGAFHKNCDDKGATIWIAKIQDEKDISTVKLGYVNNAALVIYCDTFEGPSMGELDCADSNEWTYRATYNDYLNINIPETFTVDCYEVFQVKIY